MITEAGQMKPILEEMQDLKEDLKGCSAMDIYKTERALDKRERKNQVRLDTWTGVSDVETESSQDEQEQSVPEVQELP